MIGSIGNLVFEASANLIRTFDSWTDQVSARIGSHEVGGSEPVLEYIGPGPRAIDISIALNASLGVDVESDISKAQEYCRTGQLLLIVIGGKPIGGAGAQWMIETVDASRSKFDSSGAAILADIGLSIKLARTANTPTPISSTITKSNTKKVKK